MIEMNTADAVDLTPAEIDDLIAVIQSTKTVSIDAEGEEVVVYESTLASEAAFDRLLTSFKRLIDKVTRASKVLKPDDAEGLVLMEFVAAVRKYKIGEDLPFLASIGTILMRRMSDANRTNDLVRVPENVGARYWALVHKHGGSVEAAYEECRTTSNNFDPSTFLAVHRAMGHVESLDLDDDAEDGEGNPIYGYTDAAHLSHAVPGPEESLVQADLVRWLFTTVDHRKEQILRLRYGFDDIDSQNLRLAAGFRDDAESLVMSDKDVATCLHSSTQTVNRQRNAALVTMREAMQTLVDEAGEE